MVVKVSTYVVKTDSTLVSRVNVSEGVVCVCVYLHVCVWVGRQCEKRLWLERELQLVSKSLVPSLPSPFPSVPQIL